MDNSARRARAALVFSMFAFGTIGIFRRYIPLASGLLAMSRGFIGALFLLVLVVLRKQKLDREAIRGNLILLIVSGALIGFNWILLFEAYRYTTVATATLCYYLAPTFVMLASPFVLGERLTKRKLGCVVISFVGMVLVSGVLSAGFSGVGELQGVLLGLGAAALYASVVLMNKRLGPIPAYDKTILQLISAAVVLIPYVIFAEKSSFAGSTPFVIFMLLVVGIVHTGLSYALYFGSMSSLPTQTVAIFSYIDPVVAVILSALLLKEEMTVAGIVGAGLILGAAIWGEMPEKEKMQS